MKDVEFRKKYESLKPTYASVRALLLVRQQKSRMKASPEDNPEVQAEGK